MNIGFWSGMFFGCCIGAVITFFVFMISEIRTETKKMEGRAEMDELTERKYTESYYSDKFLAGGSELFTAAGKSGYEVRFRTLSYEKFRAAEEACRRVLDGKESE